MFFNFTNPEVFTNPVFRPVLHVEVCTGPRPDPDLGRRWGLQMTDVFSTGRAVKWEVIFQMGLARPANEKWVSQRPSRAGNFTIRKQIQKKSINFSPLYLTY